MNFNQELWHELRLTKDLTGGHDEELLGWKFELIAVQEGLKPVFLLPELKDMENLPLNHLEMISKDLFRFGFGCTIIARGELHSLEPNAIFRYLFGDGMGLWVYHGKRPANIEQFTNGKMPIGIALGYPECCVKEFAESETVGSRILVASMPRPPRTIDEAKMLAPTAYAARLTDIIAAISNPTMRHYMKSSKKFPFISHIACSKCIDDPDSPSSVLNSKLETLAKSLGPRIHRELLRAAESRVETNQHLSEASEDDLRSAIDEQVHKGEKHSHDMEMTADMNPNAVAIQNQCESFKAKYGDYPIMPINIRFLWELHDMKDGFLDYRDANGHLAEHGQGAYMVSFVLGADKTGVDGISTVIGDQAISFINCIKDANAVPFPGQHFVR